MSEKVVTDDYIGKDRRRDQDELVSDVITEIGSKIFYAVAATAVAIIVAIGTATTAWISVKTDLAVVQNELMRIDKSIADTGKDRYYGGQAVRDFALQDKENVFLQQQIDQVKQDHNDHAKRDWHDAAGLSLQRLLDYTTRHDAEHVAEDLHKEKFHSGDKQ